MMFPLKNELTTINSKYMCFRFDFNHTNISHDLGPAQQKIEMHTKSRWISYQIEQNTS